MSLPELPIGPLLHEEAPFIGGIKSSRRPDCTEGCPLSAYSLTGGLFLDTTGD